LNEEYRRIKASVEKARVEITVHKTRGTFENLWNLLDREKPGAIHFSGHGLTAAEIKKENEAHQPFTCLSD